MTIVCGTDFSPAAATAGRVAAALAARTDTTLLLAHATGEHEAAVTHPGTLEALHATTGGQLEAQAELLRAAGARVETRLLPGVADEALVTLAESEDAELVVVASLGQRARDRWLLGSVADRTAQACPVPVLVVRDAAPFEAWLRRERPLRVLVGLEFSAASQAAVRWVGRWRLQAPCDVVLGYVAWPPGEHERAREAPVQLDHLHPDVERVLRRDLQALVGQLPGEGGQELRIDTGLGRVDHHLVTMAEDAQADLVVVGTHQRTGLSRLWHGSTSRGVLHLAPMSVVCVPGGEAERVPAPATAAAAAERA